MEPRPGRGLRYWGKPNLQTLDHQTPLEGVLRGRFREVTPTLAPDPHKRDLIPIRIRHHLVAQSAMLGSPSQAQTSAWGYLNVRWPSHAHQAFFLNPGGQSKDTERRDGTPTGKRPEVLGQAKPQTLDHQTPLDGVLRGRFREVTPSSRYTLPIRTNEASTPSEPATILWPKVPLLALRHKPRPLPGGASTFGGPLIPTKHFS